MLTNTEFSLSVFHPHHIPDENFWNKTVSLMVHAEDINVFLTDCSMKENIDLSQTLDQSFPNRAIHNYCMYHNTKSVKAKDNLKQVAFK